MVRALGAIGLPGGIDCEEIETVGCQHRRRHCEHPVPTRRVESPAVVKDKACLAKADFDVLESRKVNLIALSVDRREGNFIASGNFSGKLQAYRTDVSGDAFQRAIPTSGERGRDGFKGSIFLWVNQNAGQLSG